MLSFICSFLNEIAKSDYFFYKAFNFLDSAQGLHFQDHPDFVEVGLNTLVLHNKSQEHNDDTPDAHFLGFNFM